MHILKSYLDFILVLHHMFTTQTTSINPFVMVEKKDLRKTDKEVYRVFVKKN